MTDTRSFNNQSLGEEVANAISHGVGALLALAGAVVLILLAARGGDVPVVVGCSLYSASLFLLYLMSTLYHSLQNPAAKRVFQVFDHCSIFLLILGTYAPICLGLLRGGLGWTLFGVNIFCTVLGVVSNSIDLHRWHRVSLLLYLVMGWSVIFAIRPLLRVVPRAGFALLLAGGVLYSVGMIFYRMKSVRFMHAVWHLFVLGGSVLHYFFVLFFVALGTA